MMKRIFSALAGAIAWTLLAISVVYGIAHGLLVYFATTIASNRDWFAHGMLFGTSVMLLISFVGWMVDKWLKRRTHKRSTRVVVDRFDHYKMYHGDDLVDEGSVVDGGIVEEAQAPQPGWRDDA